MDKFQTLLKSAEVDGKIPAERAKQIGFLADQLLESSANILARVKNQVGNDLQEPILEFLGQIQGVKFNKAAFHNEREPEGQ